ncbi:RHO GTPase-activating protein [Wickerhamomyces ciferrii]|uniref:RHO GTPase-activating protein n=1 Tax=Wickerhamomyces ciferrii (strain ATCC 14091 / BCRC 22168 / CBS 111 / JCM 3599 / NBRC 0793 / NRRL Y-1031 F-60-10) TaxID=1206466 RepID=K0KCM4_WICCF|nr:RHO GTPase-activating protein [Wickerhamomyces ciferrii]CCH40646.1 RHO GTPase-activating protein [Wickerhamomyces ciferrii]
MSLTPESKSRIASQSSEVSQPISVDQSSVQDINTQSITPNSDQKIQPASSPELLDEDKIIKILGSDGAIDALLGRLKKSVLTCEEFSKYIRKKALLEEDHFEHLKKISKTTQEALKATSTLKSDSFVINFDKIVKLDDRIAQHGSNFSKSLHNMNEELSSLGSTISKSRKLTKENFRRKEKEVIDAITAAEKAKNKYDGFCLELERLKTTDPTKKTFTLKGSKTTTEQEEILQRKIEGADADYRQKVATSTGLRSVFLNTFRPSTAKNLKNMIIEIDIAMSVQLQKYASKVEENILSQGLSVSPISGKDIQSIKSIAASINNERDLYNYILRSTGTAPNKQLIPVEYRPHPSITPSASSGSIKVRSFNQVNSGNKNSLPTAPKSNNEPLSGAAASPSLGSSNNTFRQPSFEMKNTTSAASSPYLDDTQSFKSSMVSGPRPISVINNDNVPLPPGTSSNFKTFGTPISDLIEFEGEMVPSVVRQCIYVIDRYGLEKEGIYRTSGNVSTVHAFKDLIDKDPSNIKLILPNPNSISDSDVYAVASLLKLYFSSLPEALLTNEASKKFLEYIKIPEPELRLKRVHQVVYDLPDGSYWTLRSLIFHLSKVVAKQEINLMNSRNLGIIWGPNLFPKDDFNASDMSYQGKLVEELIHHVNDIFEAE